MLHSGTPSHRIIPGLNLPEHRDEGGIPKGVDLVEEYDQRSMHGQRPGFQRDADTLPRRRVRERRRLEVRRELPGGVPARVATVRSAALACDGIDSRLRRSAAALGRRQVLRAPGGAALALALLPWTGGADMPFVLAESAGAHFKTGRYLRYGVAAAGDVQNDVAREGWAEPHGKNLGPLDGTPFRSSVRASTMRNEVRR